MKKQATNVIISSLSRTLLHQYMKLEVNIFKTQDAEDWILELKDEEGEITVWPGPYKSDHEAWSVFVEAATDIWPRVL